MTDALATILVVEDDDATPDEAVVIRLEALVTGSETGPARCGRVLGSSEEEGSAK